MNLAHLVIVQGGSSKRRRRFTATMKSCVAVNNPRQPALALGGGGS